MDKFYADALATFLEEFPPTVDLDSKAEVMKAVGVAEQLRNTICQRSVDLWEESKDEDHETFVLESLHPVGKSA